MNVYACAIMSTLLLIAFELVYLTRGRNAISRRCHLGYLSLLAGLASLQWVLPRAFNRTSAYLLGTLSLSMMINWVVFLSVFIFVPQVVMNLANALGVRINVTEGKIRLVFAVIAGIVAVGLSALAVILLICTVRAVDY
jgi:hypothetical protein